MLNVSRTSQAKGVRRRPCKPTDAVALFIELILEGDKKIVGGILMVIVQTLMLLSKTWLLTLTIFISVAGFAFVVCHVCERLYFCQELLRKGGKVSKKVTTRCEKVLPEIFMHLFGTFGC